MNHYLLPLGVRTQLAYDDLWARIAHAWQERDDESGMDEAVTKMIWLAVGIAMALAAAAFFKVTFGKAQDAVPNPVAP